MPEIYEVFVNYSKDRREDYRCLVEPVRDGNAIEFETVDGVKVIVNLGSVEKVWITTA